MWVRARSANPSADAPLFHGEQVFSPSSLNALLFYRPSGTQNLAVRQTDIDGSASTSTVTGVFTATDWYHVAVTVEAIGENGTRRTRIYVDGVLQATANLPVITPPDWDDVFIGHDWDIHWDGLIDDVVMAPYAMASGQIAALHAMAKAMSPLPRYYIDGTFVSAPQLEQLAVGRVESMPYRDGNVDGTFYTNMQDHNFVIDAF
jgi:hypothetical protein